GSRPDQEPRSTARWRVRHLCARRRASFRWNPRPGESRPSTGWTGYSGQELLNLGASLVSVFGPTYDQPVPDEGRVGTDGLQHGLVDGGAAAGRSPVAGHAPVRFRRLLQPSGV